MASDLTKVTPQLLAQGLMALRETSMMPLLVNRAYETLAGQRGSTIDVPIPSAIAVQAVAPAAVPPSTADVAPTSVALALDQWWESPFYLTDKEQLQVMEGTIPMQASEAIKALANKVNSTIFALYKDIYGYVGTAGTTPFASSTSDATNVRKTLNKQLAPMDPRHMVIDPDAEANALNLRAFQDASFGGGAQAILDGQINKKLGFGWYMSQLIPTHTKGTGTGYLVDQANVAVGDKTINVDTGTGTYLIGDVFTVAGDTQTYVVTANELTGGNDKALAFEPGAKVAWADDAAITFKLGGVQNLGFHRDAFAFASRPLESAAQGLGAIIRSAVDPESGLTLRLEVSREHKRTRFSYDMLWGVKTVRRELACRLAG